MNRATEVIRSLLHQCFKPKEVMAPSAWVEQHVRLSSKTSNLAGRYSLRHTPYLRKLYDDLADPRVRKIVVKKAAQLGLTQYASNALLYYVCNFAFPALMIMPSKEAAQHFCERSLTPSIELCSAVKPYLTGKHDDLKRTEFLFTSSIVRVIGAGSPSKLASNPAALVIVDESDKQEDFSSQGEAPALELAEDRTITFPDDKKILVFSTPTTENTSVVHSEYLKGSQSKYFVTCPHCQLAQVLRFEQVKWPDCKLEDGTGYDVDRVEREAYYQCEACKAHLTEQDKLGMVRDGQWKDTNTKAFPAEVRSYQISALYSFNVTWGSLAKMFLLSKDDAGKLRNFYNSYLGECFEQRAASIRPTYITELVDASPEYYKGELPDKPLALLMSADTQDASLWYMVQAVYPTYSAVVDWGQAQTFEELTAVSKKQYRVADDAQFYSIYGALIDSAGHRTQAVYDFCQASAGKFVPLKGGGHLLPVQTNSAFMHKGNRLPLVHINDKQFKDVLYLSVIKERAQKLYLPKDTDEELKIQLSSENLVERKDKRGGVSTEWVCTNRRNHLGDCAKYLEAFKVLLEPQLALARSAPEIDAPAPQAAPAPVMQPAYSYGWD